MDEAEKDGVMERRRQTDTRQTDGRRQDAWLSFGK